MGHLPSLGLSSPVLKLEDKNATFPTRQWLWKVPSNANAPYLIFHVFLGGQGYFCPHLAISRPRACPFPQRTPRSQAEVGGQGWGTRSRNRIAFQSEQHTPLQRAGHRHPGGPATSPHPDILRGLSFGVLPTGFPGCPQACFGVASTGWG